MAAWQSMFPTLSEEWPSPQFAGDEDSPPPARNTGKGTLDFGSMVIRDTLVERVPISRPSSRNSSNAGTLVVKGTTSGSMIQRQGGNEGLAWAAAMMQNKDLLAGQEGDSLKQSIAPSATPSNQPVPNSPHKLLSIFDPPPASKPGTGKHRVPVLEPLLEESSEAERQDQQSATEPIEETEAVQPQAELHREFTFSCPRERTSWKSLPHFGQQAPVASPKQSPTVSPRHPFTTRSFGQSGQQSRSTSSQSSPSPSLKPTPVQEKPLNLFQFTYDTYTRDRLEALVEEIDSQQTIPRNASEPAEDEPRWEGLSEEVDEDEERPIYRSSKRIRLSPSDERPISRIPSTPRSAVRDRIRERRSMPQFQEPSTPLPAHRPAFSLPSASINPTQPQPIPTSAQLPVPIYLQPETPRPPSSKSRPASTNPVQDRLQEAQALMNRIKQQPRASVSSFEASSSAASASVNRRNDESRDTPEYDDRSHQQQPRTHLAPSDYRSSATQSGISTMNLGPPHFDFKPSSRASTQSGTSGSGTIKQNRTVSSRGTVSTRLTSSYGFGPNGSKEAQPIQEQANQMLLSPAANQRATSSSSSNGWSNNLKSGFDSSSIAPSNHHSQSSRNAQSQASSRSHQSNQSQHTRGLTTIAPEDIQHLLAPVQGKMVFDPQQQRWVKTSQLACSKPAAAEEEEVEHSSDDVFKDIESFASRPGSAAGMSPGVQIEQSPKQLEPDHSLREKEESLRQEEEESFRQRYEADGSEDEGVSFDRQEQPEDQQYSDREEEQFEGTAEYREEDTQEMPEEDAELDDQGPLELFEAANQSSQSTTPPDSPVDEHPAAEMSFVQPTVPAPPAESPYVSTFNDKTQGRAFSDPLSTPAAIRPNFPPRSVLKTRSDPMISTPQDRNASPAGYKSRSVSFSDGRIAGKMQNVPIRVVSPEGEEILTSRRGSGLKYEVQAEGETYSEPEASPAPSGSASAMGSARTKRIDGAIAELNNISDKTTSTISAGNETTIISNARSKRSRPRANSFIRTKDPFRSSENTDNATFLTNCSFAVAKDKLVQFITDVQPYETYWEDLRTIDLSHKGADSLARLNEYLPSLDEADFSHNEISYLTGMPTAIRTLLMSSNRLTSLTSFGHLKNLERLDISSNQLDSVAQLTCLVHLRELNVDHNQITSIDGLSQLDGLIKLSMKGNQLSSIDFSCTKWRRLESLNLSKNQLVEVSSLDCLESCISLNLDNNSIRNIGGSRRMPRLRILRICDNPLESIEVACFCGLRTLLLDNAYLSSIANLEHLKKLENFSIRNQKGHRIQLQSSSLRDLRRLYFSGNKLPRSFPANQYYNLVYLELAMCQLSALPEGFASLIPNCRSLNLNHNFLEDLSPLAGLARLRRLTLVGSRIQETASLASVIERLPELEVLDLRMNPLTLAFYPPLTYSLDVQKTDGGLGYSWPDSRLSAPSEKDASAWRSCDTQFKKVLPDRWYLRRTAYRGALMQANTCLKTLDGLDVESGSDRSEILELLKHMPAKLRD